MSLVARLFRRSVAHIQPQVCCVSASGSFTSHCRHHDTTYIARDAGCQVKDRFVWAKTCCRCGDVTYSDFEGWG